MDKDKQEIVKRKEVKIKNNEASTGDKQNFILEIKQEINKRKYFQNFYKFLRVILMVTIAVCGFLTASSGLEWLKQPHLLFWFGLVSTVCAVLNQSLNPSDSYHFNQSARKAMQYIKGEVEYGDMSLDEANQYKSLAMTNPEIVHKRLEGLFTEK